MGEWEEASAERNGLTAKRDWKRGKLVYKNPDLLARMEISTGFWSPSPALLPRMVINHYPRSNRSRHMLFEMCSRIKNGTLRPSDPHQRWTRTFISGRAVHQKSGGPVWKACSRTLLKEGTASCWKLGLSGGHGVPGIESIK